jgi:hypothetical protein
MEFEQHTILAPAGAAVSLQWFVGYEDFDRLHGQLGAVNEKTYFEDGGSSDRLTETRERPIAFQVFDAVVGGYEVRVFGGKNYGAPAATARAEERAA